MKYQTNNQNVEGHNETNQLGNIHSMDFFRIKDLVVKGQKRMKDKNQKQQITEAWIQIERAWYNSQKVEE